MGVYIQQVAPPPNKKMYFSLKDFSGGMNNRSDQIEDNQGAVVSNLMFADDTILETRYGQKYYDDKTIDGEVVFIDEFRPYRDEPMLVRATKDKIYFGNEEYPISGKPDGVNHLGHYYFTDGGKLKVYAKFNQDYDGKNPITDKEFSEKVNDPEEYVGMTIMERAKKAVEKAEKSKDKNDIRKAREYVGALAPTDERDALNTKVNAIVPVDPPEVDLSLTYLKTTGTKLDGYHVYTVVSPPKNYTRLGAEHVQGVTNINYTKKEVYYEPCDNEFEDHLKGACVVPESNKYIVSHGDRLFASGDKDDDDNVFITDLINPLYFAVGLPLQIPPTSDKVTGLHVFDDSVIVGRAWDMYVIIGKTNNPQLGLETFRIKKLNTHTGLASNSAIDVLHNYLVFLGSDGTVYGIQNTRANERDLSSIILSRTIDLEADPINVTPADYPNASSAFFNEEWHLSVGDKVMVYSYRHMSWVMYTGLDAKCFYGIDGEWIWGRPEGRIAMFDKENFFDFGEPYQSLWYSKIFDMDHASKFKQFREFFLVAHTFPVQYSDIYVTFEIDYANVKDRAVISNKVSRWGIAKFGDRYVSKNINESVPFIIGRRGRNIRILATNSYTLKHKVDTIEELEYIPEKKDNLLVKVGDKDYYLYFRKEWILLEEKALNQRMKIYQINGEYELRGNR